MDMNQVSQVILTNLLLIIALAIIVSVIWALIKYSIVDIVCEYDLEHPIITFLSFGSFHSVFGLRCLEILGWIIQND